MPPVVTLVVLGLLVLVIVVILVRCIRIVQQSRAYIIERLGAYHATWNVGLHFKIPFIERVAKVVSLKEQVADFQPQPVITKDNVTMQIDTVVYFQITDPMLYTYGIDRPLVAIENLSATTLRNIIGDLELDQCLTSRDVINTKMRSILDEATAILRAEAKKQAQILEAEGRAEAILAVQRATADSIKLLNEAAPSDQVIRIRALEAFAAAADGKATKIIIPSEIQGLAGLAEGIVESVKEPKGESN